MRRLWKAQAMPLSTQREYQAILKPMLDRSKNDDGGG
jgi:hypothetical protein